MQYLQYLKVRDQIIKGRLSNSERCDRVSELDRKYPRHSARRTMDDAGLPTPIDRGIKHYASAVEGTCHVDKSIYMPSIRDLLSTPTISFIPPSELK